MKQSSSKKFGHFNLQSTPCHKNEEAQPKQVIRR